MKLTEVKLRCRDFPNRRKLCDFMLVFWFLLATLWIWHTIVMHDFVYLIFGTITAACGIVYTLHLTKIELYESGIRFGGKFYRWSELKIERSGDYILLKARKGVVIPLCTSKLEPRIKEILQKFVDNI